MSGDDVLDRVLGVGAGASSSAHSPKAISRHHAIQSRPGSGVLVRWHRVGVSDGRVGRATRWDPG